MRRRYIQHFDNVPILCCRYKKFIPCLTRTMWKMMTICFVSIIRFRFCDGNSVLVLIFFRALKPPGYFKPWHVGVRVSKNQKLVGFITGIPSHVSVYNKYVHCCFCNIGRVINMAEINFLCVHKKLREKRLAPVLIMEITRRVNVQNMWQAVYTAGKVLPKPVTSCRCVHPILTCLTPHVDITIVP